jgi:hypothetical protein
MVITLNLIEHKLLVVNSNALSRPVSLDGTNSVMVRYHAQSMSLVDLMNVELTLGFLLLHCSCLGAFDK